jgi:hypothetical protein
LFYNCRSQDSSLYVAVRLWAEQLRDQSWIPGRDKRFFSCPLLQIRPIPIPEFFKPIKTDERKEVCRILIMKIKNIFLRNIFYPEY